jgi:hypothetical protein
MIVTIFSKRKEGTFKETMKKKKKKESSNFLKARGKEPRKENTNEKDHRTSNCWRISKVSKKPLEWPQ